MKIDVRTPYNSRLFPKNYEVNDLPSMTVPDQSMTVREMIDRHVRGIPFEAGKVPVYNGDDDFFDGQDFSKMELTDRMDLLEAQKQQVKDLSTNLTKQQRKAAKKAAEAVKDVVFEDVDKKDKPV